eukprot:1380546-Amorphochlora_amoeboformis.AAC.1
MLDCQLGLRFKENLSSFFYHHIVITGVKIIVRVGVSIKIRVRGCVRVGLKLAGIVLRLGFVPSLGLAGVVVR